MIIDEITKNINYEKLLNIGILLSAQRNMSMLFDTIVTEAMDITNCDGGTLYICEDNVLEFKIMRNNSMNVFKGGKDEPIDLPPVPISEANVCAYVVIQKELENINDVYNSEKFDFSGPMKYDKITGYRTQSMMVIPLENNKGEIVGVLQLINAKDKDNNTIPFDKNFEPIFRSIASQAAIALTNMKYTKDIKNLFNSLVQVLATAIDERTPYNANHTKNVAALVSDFIDYINLKHDENSYPLYFDDNLKEQTIMAAWLHDVGKITTPLEVMDKSSRLGDNIKLVEMRFELIYLMEEVNYLKGNITEEQWKILSEKITNVKELCIFLNTKDFLDDSQIEQIHDIASTSSVDKDGKIINWLTPTEHLQLTVKKGTLTSDERKIMEDHVVITEKLLSKIEFSNEYKSVPFFAASHHEKLNGKGYPKGLSQGDLPVSTRILGIMDVFEALIANDRPYKKSMSPEKALIILEEMVKFGELDEDLVGLLKEKYNA